MKKLTYMIFVNCAALTLGCATAPKELVDARRTYAEASTGPASQTAPQEMSHAKTALAEAEAAFVKDPKSYHTRDLAYVAQRKAQMAEVRGAMVASRKNNQTASNAYERTQGDIINKTKQELGESKLTASKLQTDLAKLAAVKEESRGLVITLSGSVLFATNKSVLLPAAQARLNQVTKALMENKERKLIVEGHTDSKGAPEYNMKLSQRRADAVRAQLISNGYPPELIVANGMGDQQPVTSNDTAENRANNRRVEIVVVPAQEQWQ